MGRHTLPDGYAAQAHRDAPSRRRRRTIAIATMLVLTMAAGTAVAAKGGFLSFSESCEDSEVELSMAVSPDIAPAVRAIADKAREDQVRSDDHCLSVTVAPRDSHKVADALATGAGAPDYQV